MNHWTHKIVFMHCGMYSGCALIIVWTSSNLSTSFMKQDTYWPWKDQI